MTRWEERRALALGVAALVLALILAANAIPFLRGGYGWRWPYQPVWEARRALPLVAALAVYVVGAAKLQTRARSSRLVRGWALLGAATLPLFGIALRHEDVLFTLFARTASPLTTGPHMAGAQVDWSSRAWLDWGAVMEHYRAYSVHVALAPPGLPLFYGLLGAALDRLPALAEPMQRALLPYQCHNYTLLAYSPGEWASAWFGVLMPLWAALAVFPLYGVTRRLYHDARIAQAATLWWPLVPALVLFAPTWNTFYPLLSLAAFWCWLRALEGQRTEARWALGAGALLGLLTFANFSTVPLGALLGVYALVVAWQQRLTLRRVALLLGTLGFGAALPWALFMLAGGASPWALLQTAMAHHLELERPYWPWLWLHSWDWAIFTGLPLIALWLGASVPSARERDPLGLALLVTVAALVVSGTARGETGRVWLFFAPFVLSVAAATLLRAQKEARRAWRSWAAVTCGQAALLLALALSWDVIGTELTPPPEPPPSVAASHPLGVQVGNALTLSGWDAAVEDGALTLRLNWQPLAPITRPYWFSALLLGPDGQARPPAQDWQPLQTRYPTTCWAVGQTVSDSVTLPLPADAPSGDWWVSLAVFPDVTRPNERLTVRWPDGATDTQIGLGPIAVQSTR